MATNRVKDSAEMLPRYEQAICASISRGHSVGLYCRRIHAHLPPAAQAKRMLALVRNTNAGGHMALDNGAHR